MNLIRSEELKRDFIHSRQNWDLFGWPPIPLYSVEDRSYLDMLEGERLAGRIEIEGTIKTLADYPEYPE